jgi:hypothetical protein
MKVLSQIQTYSDEKFIPTYVDHGLVPNARDKSEEFNYLIMELVELSMEEYFD